MHRFALLLLVAVGCAPAADVPKPARTGTDWPTFGGPTADLSSPDKGILTTWPKDGLKKLWDCRMGDGYAPPVVADGRLIHFDRFEDNLVLTARHAETGKKLWDYKTPTEYEDFYGYDPGPRACPVIDGERVYAYGPDGQLFCVKAATAPRCGSWTRRRTITSTKTSSAWGACRWWWTTCSSWA